jgi:predicted nucleic acid-binding protein
MRLVADTSVVIAAIIDTEPRHAECLATLEGATRAFICPQVITEVCWLLAAAGHDQAAVAFLADVAAGYYELLNPSAADHARAAEIMAANAGAGRRKKPKRGMLGLADAMNSVIAARAETTLIASLDPDYRAMRPLAGPAYFTLLPDDGV